ncbi:MAG: hypothetical protein LQ338_002434 [Usnochroma carphineum]|nr:MAG: hypothetical protein LQ338_002434 [Usnochroma carphineum]
MHANRIIQCLALVAAIVFIASFQSLVSPSESLLGPRTGGFEDAIMNTPVSTWPATVRYGVSNIDKQLAPEQSTATRLLAGSPKPNTNHSRIVVIPSMQEDDIRWIQTELPTLDVSIYIANNPAASRHPPKNKGHEVMIYLSYLIDNYNRLPDIVVFMHSHRWTHHNNHMLGFDASQMIRALNSAHVIREGYVNMRCHWSPGCPEWLRPRSAQDVLGKQEETVLERCWRELFPFDPLPSFLAQPCCAQFALSKARILSIPRSRYVFYRDWILRTPLSDYISGRIWEYSWQYLFTRDSAHCPAEHVCYCDGFGVCFGGEVSYQQYWELLEQKTKCVEELKRLGPNRPATEPSELQESNSTSSSSTGNHSDRRLFLRAQIADLEAELDARKLEAQRRGTVPRLRAEECGRPWSEGDGF